MRIVTAATRVGDARAGQRATRKALGVVLLFAVALELVILPVVVLQRKQDVKVLGGVVRTAANGAKSPDERPTLTTIDQKTLGGIVLRSLRSAPVQVAANLK